jgi:hypothetical protein
MKILLFYIALSALSLSANHQIVPGSAIGPIHLGAPESSLEKSLGTPDESDAAMGLAWVSWKLPDGTISSIVLRTKEGHDYVVHTIRTTSKSFKIDREIGVGTGFSEIHKKFPSLSPIGTFKLSGPRRVTLYDANAIGIAFEISSDTCIGIVVHEPSQPFTGTTEERSDWKSLTENP